VRGLFSIPHPSFDRVLVIESGPREVTEQLLDHLYSIQRSQTVDLLTCFEGAPRVFDSARGTIFCTSDRAQPTSRRKLIRALSRAPYTSIAILCTGSSILAKWKWIIALRTSAKILIVNEHGGFFSLDWRRRHTAKLLLSQRLRFPKIQIGLAAELLLVPFTIAYLLLYAGAVHGRRLLRTRK